MKLSQMILLLLAVTSLSLSSCVGISLFSDVDTDDTAQNRPIPPSDQIHRI